MNARKSKPSIHIFAIALLGIGLIALGGLTLAYLLRSDAGAVGSPGGYETVTPAQVNFPAPELNVMRCVLFAMAFCQTPV
jgi:hypothetical protein